MSYGEEDTCLAFRRTNELPCLVSPFALFVGVSGGGVAVLLYSTIMLSRSGAMCCVIYIYMYVCICIYIYI